MLCEKCKKNMAVVFITKIEAGQQKQMGYCISCARELGVAPLDNYINDYMDKLGISEDELEEMNKMIMENPPDFSPEMMQEMMPMVQSMFAGGAPVADEPSENAEAESNNSKGTSTKTINKKKKRTNLELFCTNLNDKASNGLIDRVIGREVEIERVTQILNRRSKNNPVLLGEPGVGKTAIAEGLAVRIVNKEVPQKLMSKQIYLLDLAALVAGTQFRGQFEGRIKALIEEAKKAGNVIFVIDEVHNIVAAGDSEGAMGAANILKPALAKGEIQVIGATTLEEYRKHIEKDSALERRFQSVIVEEPSIEESIEIIKGIKDYYENHHRVKISDEIIELAVKFSKRYITDRFLPDKAIDVLDEAGSRANLNNKKLSELEKVKMKLEEIREIKTTAVEADSIEDYQKAADLKVEECKLEERLKVLEAEALDVEITPADIGKVIEMWTKIPVARVTEYESDKLMNLEARLHERLIGQNNAVDKIARAIRVNRAGIYNRKRPSSFIFVGPTGVGKTELVRCLAKELFDDENAMIRLDMSEYMEKHAVSKIIGSPPGYVGYDDAGQLTEKIRRRPYSVILLDEIEKAHPDIFNILLQILDEGRVTDSHGKVVNFENAIIIMTSNAGTDISSNALGFNSSVEQNIRNNVDSALKQTFRPEFLNRVDEIVIFDALSKEELKQISALMLGDLKKGLENKKIQMTYTDKTLEYVVEKGYDSKYGARPMKRVIARDIETRIAEMIITGTACEGSKVIVDADENGIVINSMNI